MRLLDQIRDVIRRKHYSIRTEQAYVQGVERFIIFHGKRHPQDMGEREISQYISHLATLRRVASGMQNQALNPRARITHESAAPSEDMIILPGVLGP